MHRFYSNPTDNVRVSVVGRVTENNVLELAAARCSKKDQFIRRKGAAIAEGRLSKGKVISSVSLSGNTQAERYQEFINAASNLAEQVKSNPGLVNHVELED